MKCSLVRYLNFIMMTIVFGWGLASVISAQSEKKNMLERISLSAGVADAPINNSTLIPKLLPDAQVQMEGMSPDWVKTLIMMQFRIETVTPEGTFASAVKALDHCAELGVNGLWINPVYERGSKGNGYGNFGPQTIEPLLTGGSNVEDSFKEVRQFVIEAHRRNIRVIFDIIVWGTAKNASLVTEHPEFYLRQNDQFVELHGGWAFDWNNQPLRTWFTEVAAAFIEKTGADGFRVDCAPNRSGYFFKEVRDAIYACGHKIIIVAEAPSEQKETFDFDQIGVTGWTEEPDGSNLAEQKRRFGLHNEYFFRSNIVEAVKTGVGIGKATLQQQGQGGRFRFYTSNLICHDDREPFVRGNLVRIGYSAIFAPYIPMWWIGEEWDNPKVMLPGGDGAMYFNTIDWKLRDNGPNRKFFEDVKRFIRIRRSNPEIFECFPPSSRDANIAKVDSRRDGTPNSLQAYARYGGGKAVLVVPNYNSDCPASIEIFPDYPALGLAGAKKINITDLITGACLLPAKKAPRSFKVSLPAEHLGVYLVEGR